MASAKTQNKILNVVVEMFFRLLETAFQYTTFYPHLTLKKSNRILNIIPLSTDAIAMKRRRSMEESEQETPTQSMGQKEIYRKEEKREINIL